MEELFTNCEINREPRWPILLRLLGASVTLHLAVLACIVYIPTVRDALNIAALAGQTEYVDKPYTKTAIGEDVRLVRTEKFHYPPGYFSPAFQQADNSPAPTIISEAKSPRVVSMPTPVPGPLSSPSPSVSPASLPSGSPSTVNNPTETPNTPATPEEAEKEINKVAAENNVQRPREDEINKRPLKDWLARANALKVKGDLDLNAVVEITIEAKLSPDCKLGEALVVQKTGDARLVEVARDMVSAISDSRVLSFLRDPEKQDDPSQPRCDARPLRFTVKLDQSEVSARVESEADSSERAAQLARTYNGLLVLGQVTKRGKDEELIYRNTKVTSEGKQITVHFSMPRQTAAEMLKKQLPTG